ncbi:MAG: ATP-dependent DNA helicase [Betaproteobacteria bacterium]|nr:ATP-dependent DNA helicase [Betaproteobacteria bacterium]
MRRQSTSGGCGSRSRSCADEDAAVREHRGAPVLSESSQGALARIFGAQGSLAKAIPGYTQRAQQLDLASRILAAIEATGMLVAEAGTGTGKTFAYLVPALLAGGKVLVSTGTKTLQDQLFDRDLPAVREAIFSGASTALLKGRANYVCIYRLERAAAESTLSSRDEASHLARIVQFARLTRSGDRAELAEVPEDSPAWIHATSTRDNCLGQECPNYKDCFVINARKNAMSADVVVINHHLFFADVMLRDEGLAELLPACNTVIFDEAHQLPDTARLFFGDSVSTNQLVELARDTRMELRAAGGALPELDRAAGKLDKSARDLRLVFREEGARYSHAQAERESEFAPCVQVLAQALDTFRGLLVSQAERSEGLAACLRRCEEARVKLAIWQEADQTETVRWVEVYSSALQLHTTPLATGELFRRQMDDHPRAWIFTSATLAVGEDFKHFKRELGLDEADAVRWESPFDFAHQALFYVPRGLPEPNDPAFTQAVVEAAWPVLRASRGRAFLLFTTLRALRRARDILADKLEREGLAWPLLVQGTGSRSDLLARFRRLDNPILLGSQSFWEGVDVRGEALSLVVIDKLPFAPPDDPVLAARIEALRAKGGNPFMELQLPQAILQLKQGAGRLIRDETDRGVLMICDTRLYSKPYGRNIRASLPPMRATRELADVEAFFVSDRIENGSGPATKNSA